MKTIRMCLAALLVAFSTATFASPMSFIMGDHGDGAIYDGESNPYGLRLDDTGQTFTVGDNLPGTYTGALLTLSFDPTNLAAGAVLSGTIIDNANGSLWDVSYELSVLTAAANGGFIAQTGIGTLTEQNGPGMFNFVGKSDGTGVFIFDNDGHRLDGHPGVGWVARGWVEGAHTNDFLMIGTPDMAPIPLPGAIWMMGAGLLTVFGFKRRK